MSQPAPFTMQTLIKALDFCRNFLNLPRKDREFFGLQFITAKVPEILLNLNNMKDGAYRERNMMVAYLASKYPSHICMHSAEDKEWEDDWRHVIVIDVPEGQVSWHVHDSEMYMFRNLETKENDWDGHTVEQKYERLLGDLRYPPKEVGVDPAVVGEDKTV